MFGQVTFRLRAAGIGSKPALDVPDARAVFRDLAIAPSSPSTLYVGGSDRSGDSRLLRSLDRGATWTRILPAAFFNLHVDPFVSTTVYALTGDGDVDKTVDGGDTWTLASDALRGREPDLMAISPSTSGLLYVGVPFDHIYEIHDGSGTAEPLGTSPFEGFFSTITVDPADPCRIYAGTAGNGLMVFTKSGAAGCE